MAVVVAVVVVTLLAVVVVVVVAVVVVVLVVRGVVMIGSARDGKYAHLDRSGQYKSQRMYL